MSDEVIDLDGLQVMVQSLISPTDGPIGDSSLWLSDGQQTALNQNDARPSNLHRSPSSGRWTRTWHVIEYQNGYMAG